MIKVVAALIENDNKVLLARRSTGDINVLGKWEFPGGKVEQAENEFDAIEREIKEEFELTIKAREFITNNECDYVSGEFNLHDHSEYKWVDKEELLEYDLAPADIPLAEYVKKVK